VGKYVIQKREGRGEVRGVEKHACHTPDPFKQGMSQELKNKKERGGMIPLYGG